jgi:hypothetical protein
MEGFSITPAWHAACNGKPALKRLIVVGGVPKGCMISTVVWHRARRRRRQGAWTPTRYADVLHVGHDGRSKCALHSFNTTLCGQLIDME